jgi:hypothetical protein
MANTTAAEATIAGVSSGRRTRVSATNGDAPRSAAASSYDDDDEGDGEGHVPEDLRQRAGVDEREEFREDEQERHAHHDLGRDEREEHDEVRRSRAAPVPAGESEREQHSQRDGDEHVGACQLERLHQGVSEGRVVPDGVDGIAPIPPRRERIPDRA